MSTVYEVLSQKIDILIDNRLQALANGSNIGDYAAYQRIAGEIRGLSLVKAEVADLAKLQQEYEDDDA